MILLFLHAGQSSILMPLIFPWRIIPILWIVRAWGLTIHEPACLNAAKEQRAKRWYDKRPAS